MQLRKRTVTYAEESEEDLGEFQQEIIEIKYQLANNLQYKQLKQSQKFVQVKISIKFYNFLKEKMELSCRFKTNDNLVELLSIPTSNTVDNTTIRAMNFFFNIRIPKAFTVNNVKFTAKPILGKRFLIDFEIF